MQPVLRARAREKRLSDANDELQHRLDAAPQEAQSASEAQAGELQQVLDAQKVENLKLQAIIYEMQDTHELVDHERRRPSTWTMFERPNLAAVVGLF